MRSLIGVIILCLLVGVLQSDDNNQQKPWLTGTLLISQTTVTKRGDVLIQPYINVISEISAPNVIIINPQLFLCIGLTEWMDINLTLQDVYKKSGKAQAFYPGDTSVGFDFQLISGEDKGYPSLLLSLEEIAPTGHYQQLSPNKKGTDSTGMGSWTSIAYLTLYQLFSLENKHFLSAALFFSYGVSAPVTLKDFNTYGGAFHTTGRVFPGNSLTTCLSFEYTLTKNWVLALDSRYTHQDYTRFKGMELNRLGARSTNQLSFAPAIEYNFNDHMGVIAGAWFSAWGTEVSRFTGGIIMLYYEYSS